MPMPNGSAMCAQCWSRRRPHVGADMGSVGSREGEGGEQSEHVHHGEACRECGGFSECILTQVRHMHELGMHGALYAR